MPLILGANSVSGGYEVDNSLRFNSGSSDSLTRTTGTPTSQQKFTWSSWCKRTNLGTYNIIQGFYTDANNYLLVGFSTSDKIDIINYPNSTTARKITTQVFRDPSAWYHILVAVDTTLATATDRIKLYVNGNQVTAFATDTAPSQNANLLTNATTTAIGVGEGGSIGYYNGYISEIYYIDGQALAPFDFGEFDSDTNIWKPIPYTGTFGTKGYYLEFKDSSALGDDTSGNGNDFTVNNLTSVDQSTDTCTNNFCTLNPLWNSFNQGTLSEGNTVSTMSSAVYQTNLASFGISKGKWYWELKIAQASDMNFQLYGVTDESTNKGANFIDSVGTTLFNNTTGKIRVDGVEAGSASAVFAVTDIVGIACNMDNKQISIYKNGVSLHSNVAMSTTSNLVFPCHISYNYSTYIFQYNFGNPPFTISSGNADADGFGNFEYAVPSGYFALCSKNLAEYA